jgi:hypothetical protein
MNDSEQAGTPQVGADVVGSDGGKIGEVIAVHPKYIVVEKGFMIPSDLYIPREEIAEESPKRIRLKVTHDQARHEGWSTEPPADIGRTTADRYMPEDLPSEQELAKGS